ncbi:MAG: WD40 repeat domain-containing protein [Myxococcota bacterium]
MLFPPRHPSFDGAGLSLRAARPRAAWLFLVMVACGGSSSSSPNTSFSPAAPAATVVAPRDASARVETSPASPLPDADRYGDVLPEGARFRLGTHRGLKPEATRHLALGDDGTLHAWSRGQGHFLESNVATGAEIRRLPWGRPTDGIEALGGAPWLLIEGATQVTKVDRAGSVLETFLFPAPRGTPRLPPPEVGVLAMLAEPTRGARASRDGTRLAVWRDRAVVVYDLGTGAPRGRFDVPPSSPSSSPSSGPPPTRVEDVVGDLVVVVADVYGTLWGGLTGGARAVWDARRGTSVSRHEGPVALAPDGQHLVVVEHGMLAWKTVAGSVLRQTKLGASSDPPLGSRVRTLVVSSDGARVVLARGDEVRVFASSDLTELETVANASLVASSPRARHLALERDGFLYVRPLDDLALPPEPPGHAGAIDHISFSPEGRVISTVGGDHWRLWNASTGEGLRTFSSPPRYRKVFISREDVLVLANGGDVLRARRGSDAPARSVATNITMAALGADGFALVARDIDPDDENRLRYMVRWYDGQGETERWSHESAHPVGLALTADHVLISSVAGIVARARASGEETARLEGVSGALTVVGGRIFVDDGAMTEVAFDGITLARVRRDGSISSTVRAVGPDGRRFAAALQDGSIVVSRGDEVAGRFPAGHRGGVTALAFSPDGRQLVSGGRGGTLLVWDLDHLPEARSRAPTVEAEGGK